MTDWAIANVPPELGPFLLLAAAHFDVFRPVAILVLGAFVILLAAITWTALRWVWRRVQG